MAPRLAVIAGPTLNALVSLDGTPFQKVSFMPVEERGRVELWPGLQVGLRL